jgi:hypothetical protein
MIAQQVLTTDLYCPREIKKTKNHVRVCLRIYRVQVACWSVYIECRSEDSFWELAFSFLLHVSPENSTLVVRLGSSHCYPLNPLTDPLGLNLMLKIWADNMLAFIPWPFNFFNLCVLAEQLYATCSSDLSPCMVKGSAPARVVLAHLGLLPACS